METNQAIYLRAISQNSMCMKFTCSLSQWTRKLADLNANLLRVNVETIQTRVAHILYGNLSFLVDFNLSQHAKVSNPKL